LENDRYKIIKSKVIPFKNNNNLQPGTIFTIDQEGIKVVTQENMILIILIHPAGKKIISASNY
jgi:methionyl-tRNA formyltransferase